VANYRFFCSGRNPFFLRPIGPRPSFCVAALLVESRLAIPFSAQPDGDEEDVACLLRICTDRVKTDGSTLVDECVALERVQ